MHEEQIYERLTVGATATDAAVIAGELAEQHKESERREGAITAVTSVVSAPSVPTVCL